EAKSLSHFYLTRKTLESDTQAKLDPARALNTVGRNELGVDDAEGGGIRRIEGRIQEVDVVEEVEKVGGEDHLDAFGDGRGLAEAHVEIPEGKAGERAIAPVVGIGSQQSRPEVSEGSHRVGKVVESGACSVVAGVTA